MHFQHQRQDGQIHKNDHGSPDLALGVDHRAKALAFTSDSSVTVQ